MKKYKTQYIVTCDTISNEEAFVEYPYMGHNRFKAKLVLKRYVRNILRCYDDLGIKYFVDSNENEVIIDGITPHSRYYNKLTLTSYKN